MIPTACPISLFCLVLEEHQVLVQNLFAVLVYSDFAVILAH